MSGVYYRAVLGDVLAFCLEYRERRAAGHKRFADYSASKGGIGFVDYWGSLGGLIFEDDQPQGEGWTASRRAASDGRKIYQPSKRGAAGKALRAEFDALEPLPSNNEFAKRFGVPMGLSYSKGEHQHGSMMLSAVFPDASFVAWVGDEFFVVLPDVVGAIERKTSEGYECEPAEWSPPEGLEPSSRARYELALAAAKVAAEGSA